MALHWLIAALVLANLLLGWRMAGVEGVDRFRLFQLHKSVGITVLALTLARLAWRAAHRPPTYPAMMPRWERAVARAVHAAFYLLMLAMPLTGWVIVSASPLNLPTLLYGTVPFPHLGLIHNLPLAGRTSVEAKVGTGHVLLASLFAALIALHVGAALKHQFVTRDGILRRMLPGGANYPAHP